jgi:hypothetical protein
MARHRKLTQKFAGFPMFKLGTSGDTFPITSPFTSDFVGLDGLSLDLQFAADKTMTARKGPTPVFTRGSTATFVGSNGLIQSAAVNAARFDHDPVTLACKGLLIEESRTNASLYSGALSVGTGWSANTIPSTTSIVDGLGPDGNNAYEVAEIANTGTHVLFNTGGTGTTGATSLINGTNYTGYIFVKKVAGSVDWIQLTFSLVGFGGTQYANFNISNGTTGNFAGLAAGTAPKIEAFSNGWYRCSITAVATSTTTTSSNLFLTFTNNADTTTRLPSYTGSTSNKVLAAMCQFEAGSFATSYIPTVASSVIRSADVCSITGSAFTGFYNPVEGSLSASVIFNAPITSATAQALIDINDTTNANRLRLTRSNTTGFAGLNNTSNSTTNVSIVGAVALQPLTTQKYSSGFKLNDYVFCVNNTQVGTDNLGALPISVTTFTIGDASAAFSPRLYLNGTISSIRYFRKRLPNEKLQALTA